MNFVERIYGLMSHIIFDDYDNPTFSTKASEQKRRYEVRNSAFKF